MAIQGQIHSSDTNEGIGAMLAFLTTIVLVIALAGGVHLRTFEELNFGMPTMQYALLTLDVCTFDIVHNASLPATLRWFVPQQQPEVRDNSLFLAHLIFPNGSSVFESSAVLDTRQMHGWVTPMDNFHASVSRFDTKTGSFKESRQFPDAELIFGVFPQPKASYVWVLLALSKDTASHNLTARRIDWNDDKAPTVDVSIGDPLPSSACVACGSAGAFDDGKRLVLSFQDPDTSAPLFKVISLTPPFAVRTIPLSTANVCFVWCCCFLVLTDCCIGSLYPFV